MKHETLNEADSKKILAENQELRNAIIAMKSRIDELEQLADTDTLTPLPNRRAFLRRLESVMRYAERHGTPVAIVFIDLDGLKRINDEYGHHAGDIVLRHVASQLSVSLRATDMVARIGGDEFGLILDHLEEANACAKAVSLMQMIAGTPVDIGCLKISVSVTAGVAALKPNDSLDSLIARADDAMYARRLHRSQI
jgi:diguanylate cyclase (GGDEF)-like protein